MPEHLLLLLLLLPNQFNSCMLFDLFIGGGRSCWNCARDQRERRIPVLSSECSSIWGLPVLMSTSQYYTSTHTLILLHSPSHMLHTQCIQHCPVITTLPQIHIHHTLYPTLLTWEPYIWVSLTYIHCPVITHCHTYLIHSTKLGRVYTGWPLEFNISVFTYMSLFATLCILNFTMFLFYTHVL